MLIHSYNREFEKKGVVKNASIIWTRQYNDSDTVQITMDLTPQNIEIFKKDHIVRKDNNMVCCFITNVDKEITEDNKEIFKVKGIEIAEYLNLRTIEGTYYENDTIPNHIKNLIELHAINPVNPNRKIPNLEFIFDESLEKYAFEKVRIQRTDRPLLEVIKALCKQEGLGYQMEFKESNTMLFRLYKGDDKTINQSEFKPVLFGISRGNIKSQRHFLDSENYRNVARVGGQGEGEDRIYTIVGDNTLSGLDRKETFIDARDIDAMNDGEDIAEDEYIELLKERGEARLSEYAEIDNFEGQADSFGTLEYKKDFDLGDKVEVLASEWNIKLIKRIQSIEEIYEDYEDIRVQFGDTIPTIADKIKSIEGNTSAVGGGSGGKGEQGESGKAGVGLNYNWQDTKLGVKREDEANYSYTDLKGDKGDKGDKGTDATVTKDKIITELGYTPLEKAIWGEVVNRPSTFPPSSHIHSNYEESIAYLQQNKANISYVDEINNAIQKQLLNKAETTDIPTKLGQLENDEGYVTQEDISGLGGGDMLKSVYDKNNNGRIDIAETTIIEDGNKRFRAKFVYKNRTANLEVIEEL